MGKFVEAYRNPLIDIECSPSMRIEMASDLKRRTIKIHDPNRELEIMNGHYASVKRLTVIGS